jgi:ABC-type molybdenum transport system ATPase subunit/photorepair protein PhrA
MQERNLTSIVDFLITEQMGDGGFNCEANRGGAVHSSLHTTISVLEGILEYVVNGYSYRTSELNRIAAEAREFILQHKLFRSDHTGEIIDKRMLMLSYPSRWRYDILRALVH